MSYLACAAAGPFPLACVSSACMPALIEQLYAYIIADISVPMPVVCDTFLTCPYISRVARGQDRLWELLARHTTMTLIILYLVYSQVSTVVSVQS